MKTILDLGQFYLLNHGIRRVVLADCQLSLIQSETQAIAPSIIRPHSERVKELERLRVRKLPNFPPALSIVIHVIIDLKSPHYQISLNWNCSIWDCLDCWRCGGKVRRWLHILCSSYSLLLCLFPPINSRLVMSGSIKHTVTWGLC